MATVYGSGSSRQRAESSRPGGAALAANGIASIGLAREGPKSVNALIEEQIIPRLLMAHSSGLSRQILVGAVTVSPADAAAFASLPLELEADELFAIVEALLGKGVSVESIFVDVLAPSARRLGQHWEDDECDFLDVAMGLWRLQEVMRQVALRFPSELSLTAAGRSALFTPMPGDEHVLGTLMVEEVFARAGWQTEALIKPKRKELLQIVAERHFDVIGLTISCDCPNGAITDLISSMRGISRSPKVKVLIGGRMVNANPEIVEEVGADGTAVDARAVLSLAESLVRAADLPDSRSAPRLF
ncbi:MAG: B12-binding domain-containing protein [Novosphingobium sp.]